MKNTCTLTKLLRVKSDYNECFRFFTVTNNLYIFGFIVHSFLLAVFLLLNATILAICTAFTQFIFISSFILNRKGHHNLAFCLVYCQIIIHSSTAIHYLGWESGFYQYLMLLAPVIFFNPQWRLLTKLTASLGIISAFAYLFMQYHEQLYGPLVYSPNVGHALLLTNLAITVIAYSLLGHYYSKAADFIESSLRTTQEETLLIAHTDNLTGLLNRRAMTLEIEAEASRAEREGKIFTLAICDIDNFKLANDQYGHEFGDHVLIHTSQLLLQSMRKHDKVARWGGEEFLILLVNTDMAEAHSIIERLREQLAHTTYSFKGKKYPASTMTFGLCSYKTELGIKECIHKADEALYCGKQSGKNRTMLARQTSAL